MCVPVFLWCGEQCSVCVQGGGDVRGWKGRVGGSSVSSDVVLKRRALSPFDVTNLLGLEGIRRPNWRYWKKRIFKHLDSKWARDECIPTCDECSQSSPPVMSVLSHPHL